MTCRKGSAAMQMSVTCQINDTSCKSTVNCHLKKYIWHVNHMTRHSNQQHLSSEKCMWRVTQYRLKCTAHGVGWMSCFYNGWRILPCYILYQRYWALKARGRSFSSLFPETMSGSHRMLFSATLHVACYVQPHKFARCYPRTCPKLQWVHTYDGLHQVSVLFLPSQPHAQLLPVT